MSRQNIIHCTITASLSLFLSVSLIFSETVSLWIIKPLLAPRVRTTIINSHILWVSSTRLRWHSLPSTTSRCPCDTANLVPHPSLFLFSAAVATEDGERGASGREREKESERERARDRNRERGKRLVKMRLESRTRGSVKHREDWCVCVCVWLYNPTSVAGWS